MDRVTIINRALARIGCLAIQSEAEPGPAGVEVVKTYDAVLEDILSKYPWHFATRFEALSRETDTPPLGWTSQFLLPPSRLALPRAYYDSATSMAPLLRFQISENRVFTATSVCFAEFQISPPPAQWPGYFRELMVLCLAAEYALEVREDPSLRAQLRRDAYGPPEYQGEGGQFKIAADLDTQAMPSKQPAGGRNPLVDVRHGYSSDDARFGWG
jgi:hypothetical protein